ncbi:hypothetical protein [Sphaerisporangium perillae]|nr:hypothetical protein [Sphaerisporangium perillae]
MSEETNSPLIPRAYELIIGGAAFLGAVLFVLAVIVLIRLLRRS